MQNIARQRIERRLDQFDGLIDMEDYKTRPQQIRTAFLSRALAAYCVQMMAETTMQIAARAITDSFHDRGIDAIYYDAKSSRLFFVQSKMTDNLEWKESGEFCDGVRKIVDGDWASFSNNRRVTSRQKEVTDALHGDTSIILVTVCVGPGDSSGPSTTRVDELAAEIDGGSDIATACHWNQKHLLVALKSESEPPKIDADLALTQYGEVDEPFKAVYGRVQAERIVELWKQHPHLSHSNIRRYAGRTDVNSAMAETIKGAPDHFWYFNNGLTVICDSLKPRVSGRIKRQEGVFEFKGMSIVNGAQTTGILADHLAKLPPSERDKVWIQIRVIATMDCPPEFERSITKYTNLQNAVTAQDFVALDPLHSRLASDFAIDKRTYVFKWGDEERDPTDACTLRDATIALACAETESWYAVQAKREISVLWQTERARYKKMFHDGLTATRVWNAVAVMREVDETIKRLASKSNHPKAPAVASHLQRVILHCVFRSPDLRGWESANYRSVAEKAGVVCHRVFRDACEYVARVHNREYVASVSKNFERSHDMIKSLTATAQQDRHPELPFPP